MCDRTLFTLDKEPRTDQSAHTTEVLRGEPISFIGVTYRNMGEGLLTGAEMTQGSCITEAHATWVTAQKAGETAQPIVRSTGWRISFQVPQLV